MKLPQGEFFHLHFSINFPLIKRRNMWVLTCCCAFHGDQVSSALMSWGSWSLFSPREAQPGGPARWPCPSPARRHPGKPSQNFWSDDPRLEQHLQPAGPEPGGVYTSLWRLYPAAADVPSRQHSWAGLGWVNLRSWEVAMPPCPCPSFSRGKTLLPCPHCTQNLTQQMLLPLLRQILHPSTKGILVLLSPFPFVLSSFSTPP